MYRILPFWILIHKLILPFRGDEYHCLNDILRVFCKGRALTNTLRPLGHLTESSSAQAPQGSTF